MMKGIYFDGIHSYKDLNLILSDVNIPPAMIKTSLVDIPGADGSIDLTEALGAVRYKDRTCSFVFSVFPYEDFEEKKKQISNLLNGRRCRIRLDKDSGYYWFGRCSVNAYASNKNLHKITVNATVEPYKYKLAETAVEVVLCGDSCYSRMSGNPLHISNMSAVEHQVGLKVGGLTRESENLVPYPFSRSTSTINGVTFTDNGNGTITANGTATENAIYYFINEPVILPKGTYTFSGSPVGSKYETYYLGLSFVNGEVVKDSGSYENGTAIELEKVRAFYAVVKKGITVENLVFKPQLEKGTTKTAYKPPFSGLRSAPVTAVESVGKNLIPFPYYYTSRTLNDVSFTVNEDTSITMKGTATANTYFYLVVGKPFGVSSMSAGQNESATNGEYTLSKWLMYYAVDKETYIYIPKGTAVDETIYPQLEKGTEATPCAPYVCNTIPIPDSIKALDGYGEGINADCFNHIDWEKKQFVKQVGKVDMGTLEWTFDSQNNRFRSSSLGSLVKSGSRETELLMAGYEVKSKHEDFEVAWHKVVYIYGSMVYVHDLDYTDVATFKTAMSGKMLVFELATPEVIDISGSLPGLSLAIDHIINADGEAAGVTNISAITDESAEKGAFLDLTYFNTEYKPKSVVLNNGKKPVVPIVECSDDNTTIEFDSSVVVVNAGKHKILDLQLKEGENPISITGVGKAKFSYQEGDL